jgi:NAD(P)-dependent dehydrogenase (short-subunit alcohol dehydrogenase family)
MGTPAFSVYSATKAAVRNFARSWAQDLRGTGIRVNVLSPGPTLTELAADVVGKEAMIEMGSGTPIGRIGDPAEIGAVAAFLASSDSSFMTGSEVFADGGLAQI